ncbi:ABC transporter substrate-binding protein [Kurthia sibirica]|uniref:ABC transporter substrate-binding protein n=1 Tax=Kurthia sibirica TaxID=202750 RepID=A0A2U3AJI1_9BACL|nr:ABC transporter substrate-binding protein [Kurthia sibirica]PWI24726.1 ABC transporter substrate-binding protein [Kurthia sibirica]GEK34755.1 peptide ABC transporter substrate-binding protein [Kurthia sibirica]
MFKKSKKMIVTVVIMAMVLVLAACGGNDKDAAKEKGKSSDKNVVNIGVTHAPSNINPLQPVGLVSTYVSNLLFLPLVDLDADLNYKPMLADSISTKDNKAFTIKLNKDAKWTNGKDITADDVIFTLELMSNETVASNYAYMFGIVDGLDDAGYLEKGKKTISGVAKIDDKTVQITTKKPTTLTIFQDTVGRYLLTLPKSELEKMDVAEVNKSDFMQKPSVTSGPFTISKIDRDHFVEMLPNKDYFKGASKLEQLNFKVLAGNQIASQMKSGEIDMNIPSAGVIPVADYKLVKNLDTMSTSYGEPLATQFMYINEKVVGDAKQRQAISYAMNRKMIVDSLLEGAGEVTDGFFTSISPYLNDKVKPVAYDAEKAKTLLSESKWDSNKTLNLSVLSGDATLEQAANIISENLNAVGVKTKIQMMDLGTLLDKIVSGKYDLSVLTVSITPINPLPDLAFFLGEGNPNYYANKRVNEILKALSTEINEAKINALYGELQEITAQDVPMPSIYATKALGAVNKRVKGATPSDFGMFINVNEWTVK